MYVCMYVFMYVCMYVCIYVSIYFLFFVGRTASYRKQYWTGDAGGGGMASRSPSTRWGRGIQGERSKIINDHVNVIKRCAMFLVIYEI